SIIGKAYARVEKVEELCENVSPVCDMAILSAGACNGEEASRENHADTGACRMLLESHMLFSIIDDKMDFSPYKLLILPDEIRISLELKTKLDYYIKKGGKLFLTGKSGLDPQEKGFVFDIGAEFAGESPYCPDYILPENNLRPDFVDSPFVMYLKSQRIKVISGKSLGKIFDPYFNRTFRHFCSHQHAPPQLNDSGFDCGVRTENIVYLAHPIFTIYAGYGAVAYREYVIKTLKSLLGNENIPLHTELPSSARISLMRQKDKNRDILHVLYAPKILRGGVIKTDASTPLWSPKPVEIIEELPMLKSSIVKFKTDRKVHTVKIEPEGHEIPFTQEKDGTIIFETGDFSCSRIFSIN
ncbi:MAG: hypothetical protein QXH80_03030, partial [Candidatus Nanoarchaeia archaeon]